MLPTLVGGAIALIIAIVFFSVVLAKISSIPLWIVVVIGLALMVASIVEAVRQGEEQLGDAAPEPDLESQQERGGLS